MCLTRQMIETASKLLGCKAEGEKKKRDRELKKKEKKKEEINTNNTLTKSVRNFLLIYIYLLN